MPDLKLVQYVCAATDDQIHEALRTLGAIDFRVGGTEAVKEFWANEPEKHMPSSIRVEFTKPGGKKN